MGKLERNEKSPTIEALDKIVNALYISYSDFFSYVLDDEINEERDFYIDMVISSLTSLPDEKLKIIANVIVKTINVADW